MLHSDPELKTGLVINLQDFVVHDGPGLRILVFLKGCPLRCSWCQNPETINSSPEIEFYPSLCLDCRRCSQVCPVPGAITEDKGQRIDRSKCINCMECVDVCLGGALRRAGERVSATELSARIVNYKPFFDRSDNGGVTLSGGEPTLQPEFTLSLLKSCQELGINTAVETCGYTDYQILKKVVQSSDLILYDIKHMDEVEHVKGTGRPNGLILGNLRRLSRETDTAIVARVPLICGFNDDDENIIETAEFVSSLGNIECVDLLPFNELASAKYKALGLEWEWAKTSRQPPERLTRLKDIVKSYGLKVTVGGLW